jgi:hypothetical protein
MHSESEWEVVEDPRVCLPEITCAKKKGMDVLSFDAIFFCDATTGSKEVREAVSVVNLG